MKQLSIQIKLMLTWAFPTVLSFVLFMLNLSTHMDIGLPIADLDATLFNYILMALGVSLVISVITSVLLVSSVTTSLQRTQQDLEEMCKTWNIRDDLPCDSNDVWGRCVRSINVMLSKFRSVLTQIREVNRTLFESAEQLKTLSHQTSVDLQKQKEQITHVTSSANQMTGSVKSVAEHANEAATAANSAGQETDRGDQLLSNSLTSINRLATAVTNAREVIQRVDEDSKQIGSVLDVIRGIAEQTNLLALNAAIEAARAGEQGRGFAVVADEVRTLAQRTQQSTREIHNMIERLQTGVAEAVTAMEEGTTRAQANVQEAVKAGESLRAIKDAINVINNMNQQIAVAAGDQTAAADNINRDLDLITEGSLRATEQMARATQESQKINQVSTQLRNVVQDIPH